MSASVRDRLAAASVGTVVRSLEALPEPVAFRAGAALGRTWAAIGPRRSDAWTNLRIAFPDWSDERRQAVLRASLENLGRSLAEFARLAVTPADQWIERVRIEGEEHLEAARAASPTGGAIILTAHFGSWELLAAAMVARGLPAAVVHRPRDNAALDAMAARLREAGGAELYARGNAAREALRALKDGKLLALPYDQNCRRNEGVFVPFFGRLACTRDGPPRIAMRTGVPVVPLFVHRQEDGVHHVARFREPVPVVTEGDRDAAITENARRWTEVIEDAVRAAPEQWTWMHRRWRTRPEGEPNPYRAPALAPPGPAAP